MKTVMRQAGHLPGFEDMLLRDPEFFEEGLVAEVVCDYGRSVHIHREGISKVQQADTGELLRTATDFRNAFGSSGDIPHEDQGWDWHNNGWFALYTPCGRPVGDRDNLAFDLPEAIAEAQDWLITTGKRMLATAVASAA